MNYNSLIATVSEIVENENIDKNGLSLTYTIDSAEHRDLQEYFFRTKFPNTSEIPYAKLFEVEVGGLLVRFVEK